MTVTPGTSGRVSINARGRDGSQSLAPRELYTAETLSVTAGDVVSLEAINVAATYTDPAKAGPALQALVSGAGIRSLRNMYPLVGASLPLVDHTMTAADFSTLSGSGSWAIELGPNGSPALRVTAPAGTNMEINVAPALAALFYREAVLSVDWGSARSVSGSGISLYAGLAGYTGFYSSSTIIPRSNPLNDPFDPAGQQAQSVGINSASFAAGGTWVGSPPTLPVVPGACKLRVTAGAGGPVTCYIYSIAFTTPRRKSRVCVIWDDGYRSTARLGWPIFAARGIPQTLSLIGSVVDAAQANVSRAHLQQIVDDGNAIVAHGPWPNGGAGNLFSAYPGSTAPVADALADMQRNRDYLSRAGLLVPGADTCYVWPQGVWQTVQGDKALLDAAIAAGFSVGRSATQNAQSFDFNRLDKYRRLCLPIIGKTWAASTAAEATDVALMVTRINAAAAVKEDLCLMLHRPELDGTADGAMTSISTRVSDLAAIADAIKANIDAGTQEAITMPSFVSMPTSYWSA